MRKKCDNRGNGMIEEQGREVLTVRKLFRRKKKNEIERKEGEWKKKKEQSWDLMCFFWTKIRERGEKT